MQRSVCRRHCKTRPPNMRLPNISWLVVLAALELCWRTSASNVPKETLHELESNLLSLFGLSGRPAIVKSTLVIPPAMIELYEKVSGFPLITGSIPRKGLHTASANTVRSFTHIESPIDARYSGYHEFRLNFNTSNVPKTEKLKAAELTLTREKINWLSNNEKENFQRVLVKDILKPGVKGKYGPITRIVDSKLVDTRSNTSLSLDVLPAVERWLKNPKSNYGLVIKIVGLGKNKTTPAHHIRLRRSVDNDDAEWQKIQPVLLTYTDDGKNVQKTGSDMLNIQRRRRAAKKNGKRREPKRESCSRHKMYVDFTEVGWNDWIVAPPGYDAYYCAGECNFPMPDHLNTTNHAIVQLMMNSVNPSKVPKPCCVPTSLNTIAMLYVDDERQVVLRNYKEMSVDGCGCR